MSIVIKNKNVPSRCKECDLVQSVNVGTLQHPNFQFYCPVVNRMISHVAMMTNESRPEDCKKVLEDFPEVSHSAYIK